MRQGDQRHTVRLSALAEVAWTTGQEINRRKHVRWMEDGYE
ncbi:MAG TPA: hypothetical protein VGC99_00480 [Candidatus Tectomicrobia bacterium]